MRCQSCEVAMIQGVRCHEHGCPDAWRDEVRECRECGCDFEPESRHQQLCSESCLCAYHGIPQEDDGWTEQDQLDLEAESAE